jgi:ribulose-bisphosphate carboxylase small chain
MMMRLETFSYLPELDNAEIEAQIRSILDRGLVVAIEHTREPSAYDHYRTLWKLPLFGVTDPDDVLSELEECRGEHPDAYIRLNGYDRRRQGQVLAFAVHRPAQAEGS